jgi:hypothetical protein
MGNRDVMAKPESGPMSGKLRSAIRRRRRHSTTVGSTAGDDRRRRRTAITMLVLGTTILGLITFGVRQWVADEQEFRRQVGLRDNPPQRQWEEARELVTGLNSRDPARVPLLGVNERAAVTRNVVAAMPQASCQYTLESVRDDGVHDDVRVGQRQIRHAYRYDMLLHEHCQDTAPVQVTIGVLSLSGMGRFWEPVGLVVAQ